MVSLPGSFLTAQPFSKEWSVKKYLPVFIFLFLAIAGAGFLSAAQDKDEPLPCDVKRVGIDPAKFYLYLTKDTPYTAWAPWPGKGQLSSGKDPHGAFVKTFLNPAALRSLASREGMALGSLLVTENYDADKKPLGLMVMLKVKGYNPQAGDWYWFQYDAEGTVLGTGRTENCINCHRSQKENDFVMTAPVKK